MRFDLLMIIMGVVLILAMALTLLYGREYSRHGYGSAPANLETRSTTQAMTA